LNFFAKHFVNHQHLYGYAQYKIGERIYSYSTWLPALVNPNDNFNNIGKPIIVLADNFSASTAEAFVMFFKTLPNGLLIGENTFGAPGAIVEDSSMNCGSFTIPDFLSVQLSFARFKFINNKIYENIVYPPDVFIPFNSTSIKEGRDLVLEKAIRVIH
jgi:C-terminal processing protease CtpA/Prc